MIEKEQVNEISWASLHLNVSEQNSQKRIFLPRKAKRKKNMFKTTHYHNNRVKSCRICIESKNIAKKKIDRRISSCKQTRREQGTGTVQS